MREAGKGVSTRRALPGAVPEGWLRGTEAPLASLGLSPQRKNMDLAVGQEQHEDAAPETTARQSMMGEGAGVGAFSRGALCPVHCEAACIYLLH